MSLVTKFEDTKGDIAIVKTLVQEAHEQYINHVAEGNKNLAQEIVEDLKQVDTSSWPIPSQMVLTSVRGLLIAGLQD